MGKSGLQEMHPAQRVRIVASCTQGKRLAVSADLRLGGIPPGPLAQRLAIWRDRIQQNGVDRITAVNLYGGQHWAVIRDLPEVAQAAGYQADLWIASAGYGLVPAKEKIRSYSATFATSDDDSVWRPGDGSRRMALRTWWNGLQRLPGLNSTPRSLSALAGEDVEAVFLVIASPAYITAMSEDLEVARARLMDPQRLIVISSRDRSLPDWVISHLVPSEAPLSSVFGGSLGSLHARTARRILQEAAEVPLHADILVPRYTHLVSEVERPTIPARLRLSDEDVRSFIRGVTAGSQGLTCTAALRKLRTSGQACEQRRFAGLYEEVTRRADAS